MQWSCSSLVLVKSEAHYDDVQYHYMARMNIYYTFSNTLFAYASFGYFTIDFVAFKIF